MQSVWMVDASAIRSDKWIDQRKHPPLRVRRWIDFLKERYGAPGFWKVA